MCKGFNDVTGVIVVINAVSHAGGGDIRCGHLIRLKNGASQDSGSHVGDALRRKRSNRRLVSDLVLDGNGNHNAKDAGEDFDPTMMRSGIVVVPKGQAQHEEEHFPEYAIYITKRSHDCVVTSQL